MLAAVDSIADRCLEVFDNPLVFLGFTLLVGYLAISSMDTAILESGAGKIGGFLLVVVLAKKDIRLALLVAVAIGIVLFRNKRQEIVDQSSKEISMPVLPAAGRLPQELDLETDFVVKQTPDGVLYQTSTETEVGKPLHPDLQHSGPQSLGDPLPGFERESAAAPY